MINVKDKIVEQLEKAVTNVSDTYPQDFTKFPVVAYCEEENRVYEEVSEGESASFIRFRIDIWNNVSTSQIAVDIDNVISQFGFKRVSCMDVPENSGLKHKLMRYEAVIDVTQKFIYHTN